MYTVADYISRGLTLVNNRSRPHHKRLSTLMIYATDLCDSACKHCLIWAKRPAKYLPFEKIKEIMQSGCVTRHTTIGLEGGEFMLHPDAASILQWFYDHHKNFDLLSNCLQPDKLIEAVKKSPPRHLYISLDGTEDTYLYMRGKPGYQSVIKVIESLRHILPVSVMFTVSPYNDFSDLQHVAEVCKKYKIDLRVGIYNDVAFFDTIDKAHETAIGSQKGTPPLRYKEVKQTFAMGNVSVDTLPLSPGRQADSTTLSHDFVKDIPPVLKEFGENFDFLVLYNEWNKGNLKMNCYSILDSLVILPNGDVPLCQSLDLKIGNIFKNSLDEVFNSEQTNKVQEHYVHNCNQCWLNYHRKYDVILYRTFEKYFGKTVTSKLFGYYQWEETGRKTYTEYFKEKSL